MKAILWIHIAAGLIALLAGYMAVAVRKGGARHAAAGTWFFGSMLVLGATASVLSPFKTPPESSMGGVIVCYFVATSWWTARRRDGTAGRFEQLACALILTIAILSMRHGLETLATATGFEATKARAGFIVGGVCFIAGVFDLNFILRRRLSEKQRIARHLWRMCFAFFIATGSFFLGQQHLLPQAFRGSLLQLALSFAPIVLLFFWLLRVKWRFRLPRAESRASGQAAV